jgi:hypothetical protein
MVGALTVFPMKGQSGRALLFTAYLLLTLGFAAGVAISFDAGGGAFVGLLFGVAALLFVPFRWLYRRAVAGIVFE